MAIYHLTVKIVSRGRGQSVVAKAAYNSREKMVNEKTGESHDYRNAGNVSFSAVFAPKDAPAWTKDRQELWSEVEKTEKRKNSQLAREIEIGLPHELTAQQREWLVKDFVRENFVRHGMVADVSIHPPTKEGDERNHHAHILLTMREIGPNGFGEKMRHLNSKAQLEDWREKWEHLANRHLERHGHNVRIDRRSLEAQGIAREPTIHEGAQVTQLERDGIHTERGDINRDIEARNKRRDGLKHDLAELEKHEESIRDFLAHQEKEELARQKAPPKKNLYDLMHDPVELGKHEESVRDFLVHREKEDISRQKERLEKARSKKAPSLKRETKKKAVAAEKGVSRAAKAGGRLSEGLLDAVDRALDFFVGSPPKNYTAAELAREPAARRDHYAQQARARERDEALDRWEEQLARSNNDYSSLSTGEARSLSMGDLENIKARGHEAIQELIRQRIEEREKERRRSQGRERERDR